MVSVIIPCYNAATFLNRAVKSVFNQEIPDLEIILVNNNSTDETANVISDIVETYKNKITIIATNESVAGACAARNNGLSLAKHKFIQFLDADDEILPNKLKRQLELANSTNADIISGTYEFLAPNAIIKRRLKRPFSDIWKGLISTQLGITSANLWRKQAIIDAGGWDVSLSSSQEYDLLFRLLKMDKKLIQDYELSCYVHAEDNSVSRSSSVDRTNRIVDNYIDLRIRIKEYLELKGLFTASVERFYSITLYKNLLYRKRFSPSYVSEKLLTLKLVVPVSVKIKENAKIVVKKLLGK